MEQFTYTSPVEGDESTFQRGMDFTAHLVYQLSTKEALNDSDLKKMDLVLDDLSKYLKLGYSIPVINSKMLTEEELKEFAVRFPILKPVVKHLNTISEYLFAYMANEIIKNKVFNDILTNLTYK